MRRSVANPPVSAVACYHIGSGAFLGLLRLRLIEALPRVVGRHMGGDPAPVRPELAWKAASDAPAPLRRVLEGAWEALSREDLHTGILETLVEGRGQASEAIARALGVIDGDSPEGGVAFLECYPWERPRTRLVDAVRAQAFHGKAIAVALRARFASEIRAVEDRSLETRGLPGGLPLAG